MGKKQQGKDEAPNPHSIVNRDVFQRLNFLYQASAYLKGLDTTGRGKRGLTQRPGEGKKVRKRYKASLGDIGSSYVRNMRTIGNKTVVRIDPNVKRMLCKGCYTVLVPGTTTSVRVKGSSATGHKVAYTCLECRTSRVIPAPSLASASVSDLQTPTSNPSASTDSMALPGTLETSERAAPRFSMQEQRRWRKRKPPVPRPLPLFARQDAGHVVFRGNEVLSEMQ